MVSLISDFISSLNPAKSNFLPLSCSINSGVNSGFMDFSIFLTLVLKIVFLDAKSLL
ncbi:MAG: hypothetical protein LBQ24_03225 [Candidatus Peribacteria bacterium]|nr:hypothetical protein [Candidatus Peribacteria bacterium]